VGVYCVLQFEQILFASLWLIIIFIAEERRNGSTHILINLWTVPGAELVWIVDTTKCPVRAASTARVAVSSSLISPTIIISGSCLTSDLSQAENV